MRARKNCEYAGLGLCVLVHTMISCGRHPDSSAISSQRGEILSPISINYKNSLLFKQQTPLLDCEFLGSLSDEMKDTLMDALSQIGVEGDFEDILSANQLNIGRDGDGLLVFLHDGRTGIKSKEISIAQLALNKEHTSGVKGVVVKITNADLFSIVARPKNSSGSKLLIAKCGEAQEINIGAGLTKALYHESESSIYKFHKVLGIVFEDGSWHICKTQSCFSHANKIGLDRGIESEVSVTKSDAGPIKSSGSLTKDLGVGKIKVNADLVDADLRRLGGNWTGRIGAGTLSVGGNIAEIGRAINVSYDIPVTDNISAVPRGESMTASNGSTDYKVSINYRITF